MLFLLCLVQYIVTTFLLSIQLFMGPNIDQNSSFLCRFSARLWFALGIVSYLFSIFGNGYWNESRSTRSPRCISSWPLNGSRNISDRCSSICLNVVTEQIGPMLGHLDCYVKINTAEKFAIDLLFRACLLARYFWSCVNYRIGEGKKR